MGVQASLPCLSNESLEFQQYLNNSLHLPGSSSRQHTMSTALLFPSYKTCRCLHSHPPDRALQLSLDQEIIHTENSKQQDTGPTAGDSSCPVKCSSQDTALSLPVSPWQLAGRATAVPGAGTPYVTGINIAMPGKAQGWESGFMFAKQTAFQTSPLWLSTLSLFRTALFVTAATAASRDTFAFHKAWLYSKSKLFLSWLNSGNSTHLAASWKGLAGHYVQQILKHFA